MKVMDGIDQSSLGSIRFASKGTHQVWQIKRNMLSPAYTTRGKDIPAAKPTKINLKIREAT